MFCKVMEQIVNIIIIQYHNYIYRTNVFLLIMVIAPCSLAPSSGNLISLEQKSANSYNCLDILLCCSICSVIAQKYKMGMCFQTSGEWGQS